VRNGGRYLESCLNALARSTIVDYECIVVDDESSDCTPQIAAAFGCRVIRMHSQSGPAAARNAGADAAGSELLLFLDADVCVSPDTLERCCRKFAENAGLDALVGSYDPHPFHPSFVSQYRNLMHCYVHQTANPRTRSFWSGCGAIRRHVFLAAGGFDETYRRPCVEDLELGSRLSRQGRYMLLDRSIQVRHLKRWTLAGMIRTDVLDRAIPWVWLILRAKHLPDDLNLRVRERVCVALVLTATLAEICSWRNPILLWLALGMITLTVVLQHRFYRFLAECRDIWFSCRAIPFHLLYYLYCGLSLIAAIAFYPLSEVSGPPGKMAASHSDAVESL
jgi:glycosyltransferase involved in cell wall biosynthesis